MGAAGEGLWLGAKLHCLDDCVNEGHWSFLDDSAMLLMVLLQTSEDQNFLSINQDRMQ